MRGAAASQLLGLSPTGNLTGVQMERDALACAIALALERFGAIVTTKIERLVGCLLLNAVVTLKKENYRFMSVNNEKAKNPQGWHIKRHVSCSRRAGCSENQAYVLIVKMTGMKPTARDPSFQDWCSQCCV